MPGCFRSCSWPLVVIDGLLIVRGGDELLFVQRLVALVEFFLVLVFGLCTVVGGALRGKFTLQCHAVHLGNELAFGYYGIVVYMNLVDDTAHLGTHFHFVTGSMVPVAVTDSEISPLWMVAVA